MTSRALRWQARLAIAATAGLIVTVSGPAAWADSVRDQQWHLLALHATDAQGVTQGDGVTVAVVDSGVDATHPDLAGSVLPGVDLTGPGDGRTDTDGHGTGMASNIAAHGHGPNNADGVIGLAPHAKILPVRISTTNQGGDVGTGIRWAVDHGAKIINVSGGGADLSKVREATAYALGKGAVIVASTGNDGSFTVEAPAMYPGVVAVGGTGRDGSLWPKSTRGAETVVTAPAVDIVSVNPGHGYGKSNGTSESAAMVSGIVALIWSKYPQLDANNVINRLTATADHQGEPGRNTSYGFGAVNPVRALTESVPEVLSNPLMAKAPTSAPPAANPSASRAPAAVASGSSAKSSTVTTALVLLGSGVVAALLVAGLMFVRRRRRKTV